MYCTMCLPCFYNLAEECVLGHNCVGGLFLQLRIDNNYTYEHNKPSISNSFAAHISYWTIS